MCEVTEQASTDARPHNDAAERWSQVCVQYQFDGIAVRCTHRSPDPNSIQRIPNYNNMSHFRGERASAPNSQLANVALSGEKLDRNSTGAGTQKAPQPKRLAVLPFTNRDGGI